MEQFFNLESNLFVLDEQLELMAVRLDEHIVSKLLTFKKDHSTSRDSGWRGLRQVVYLEHDSHGWLKLDDLTTVEA